MEDQNKIVIKELISPKIVFFWQAVIFLAILFNLGAAIWNGGSAGMLVTCLIILEIILSIVGLVVSITNLKKDSNNVGKTNYIISYFLFTTSVFILIITLVFTGVVIFKI